MKVFICTFILLETYEVPTLYKCDTDPVAYVWQTDPSPTECQASKSAPYLIGSRVEPPVASR